MVVMAVFLFGLIIGSFLNVCIYRMPKGKSVVNPPSACPSCGKLILWYDNIPLVSYAVLGGRCRFCKGRISLRYFTVELLTGLLLAALFAGFGITPKFFAYSVMTCALIVATFIDFEIECIPDEISIGGIIVGLLFAFIFPSVMGGVTRLHGFLSSLIGAAIGAGTILVTKIFGTIVFKKKVEKLGIGSAMGEGDVTLMAMIGSFVGPKLVIFTFFAAPFLGVAPAVFLKYRKGAETIPYGPYLSLAALIAIFFGNRIIGALFGGLF